MKVSVIGLGYVGSVAAAGLASAGHDVLGIDINADRIREYRELRLPIFEPGLRELLKAGVDGGKLSFAANQDVNEPLGEVVVIATGTPPTETGSADLSQVKESLKWVRDRCGGEHTVLVKSTVPPGTGERLKKTILHNSGLSYVSNPEFLREGHAIHDWFHPDRIVVGGDKGALATLQALYTGIEAPYVLTNITSAEMIKYTANAFLATKISFINEIAALCDRLGATIDDVSEGISLDPRIGPSFLKAGVGYGGSCFPKDVRALDQVALTNDHNFELLRAVITVNNRQRHLPLYALRQRFGRLSGLTVGILGVAFKPDTDDIREAPSLDLVRLLVEDGADVRIYDPKANSAARRVLPQSVVFLETFEECVDRTDAVVLMTEWDQIVGADWSTAARTMKPSRFIFDGRNALDPRSMRRLGFDYRGIGRPCRSLPSEDVDTLKLTAESQPDRSSA
ncbi:MAG: UDP-glucose/GDP-mannose dehydrogenase family protein [Chloroflexi bacterium]|nr:UDP-glucose/GDP-mannose dehydrogenase family protein [Chloroflexota bacterium]